jgi:hypothetical protein
VALIWAFTSEPKYMHVYPYAPQARRY